MIAVAQGHHPICIAAAWTNAILAVDPAVSFPGGRDALEWALHAHEAAVPYRTTTHGGRHAKNLAAVGQVFVDAELIAACHRVDTIDDVLDHLDDGPIIASLDWTAGMELPNPRTHIVRPVGARTPSRHTVALTERVTCRHSTTHPDGDFVRFRNSRGLGYGDHGDALIRVDDLAGILHQAYRFTRTSAFPQSCAFAETHRPMDAKRPRHHEGDGADRWGIFPQVRR
jgi:hypothetical protein